MRFIEINVLGGFVFIVIVGEGIRGRRVFWGG